MLITTRNVKNLYIESRIWMLTGRRMSLQAFDDYDAKKTGGKWQQERQIGQQMEVSRAPQGV
eukprot:5742642-Pyramimonas_sp.AAC.2